jgi:hypothetical protein
MPKKVTLQIDAGLVEPLLECLESRAYAWQESARLVRAHTPPGLLLKDRDPAPVQHTAEIYAALVEQIRSQMPDH